MRAHVCPRPGAFTLIELLIVAAILAVLAALALPNFREAQRRSEAAADAATLKTIASALVLYRADWNKFPLGDGQAGTHDSRGITEFGNGPAGNGFFNGVPNVLVDARYMGSREGLYCNALVKRHRDRKENLRYAYNSGAGDSGGFTGGVDGPIDGVGAGGRTWIARSLYINSHGFAPERYIPFPFGPDPEPDRNIWGEENVLWSDLSITREPGVAAMIPAFTVTGVGSVPFTDANDAVAFVLDTTPHLPAWPQLPDRAPEEGMVLQAMAACANGAMTRELAAGFFAFVDAAPRFGEALALRGQLAGPITLAFADRRLSLDDLARDVARVCAWQARTLAGAHAQQRAIVTIDEPVLGQLEGSGLSHRRAAEAMRRVLDAIHGTGALAGIHCCAATDWTWLLEDEWDVVSFDANAHGDSARRHRGAFRDHVSRGGRIAWGIVPTDAETDADECAEGMESLGYDIFGTAGWEKAAEQSLLSPACGLAGRTRKTADRAFALCHRARELLLARRQPVSTIKGA